MKLLVVDDNARMRRTIKSVVEDLADAIFECTDGTEAVQSYELNRPDWVTMDVRMKETDGIAATREIKAAFPFARIIIVSEYDEPALREDAKLAGASDFISKRQLFDLRDILGCDFENLSTEENQNTKR